MAEIDTNAEAVEAQTNALRQPLLNKDMMKRWDVLRALLAKRHVGSYPRDIFESIIDGMDEDRSNTADILEALLTQRDQWKAISTASATSSQAVVEQNLGLAAQRDAAVARAEKAQAENERLAKLVYVPGLWRCAKCRFSLLQGNLNVPSGTVTARNDPGDHCPNCDAPLWRVSERDAGNELVDRLDAMANERDTALARVAELEGENARMRARLSRANQCLGFFVSAIKCGEPWSEVCEREYTATRDSSDAAPLPAPPRKET